MNDLDGRGGVGSGEWGMVAFNDKGWRVVVVGMMP